MNELTWWLVAIIVVLLAWNVYLMWVNSTQAHDLRRARHATMRASAPRSTQHDREARLDADAIRGVLPQQRRAGEQ